MGIKRLNKFLCQHGLIIEYKNMEKFIINNKMYKSRIIAVDIMLYIYKYKYSHNDTIYGFIKQIINFLNNRIIPVYIFDGIPYNGNQI